MCLSPVHLSIPVASDKYNPNTGSRLFYQPYSPDSDYMVLRRLNNSPYGYLRRDVVVPCGKCTECLKRRQNDLSVRVMREANKRGSMVFVTLTYDNDSLPLSLRMVTIDKDSGEILDYSKSIPLLRYEDYIEEPQTLDIVKICRAGLASVRPGPTARVFSFDRFEFEGRLYRYEVTPSLYRRDVQLWLKRCRVRYVRQFGCALPNFSYVVVGEYGPKTCRPHYHICFFGLPLNIVSWFASQWNFGFFNIKKVNAINEDGTSGFEFAGRYIGKYMAKGKFECDSVKCDLAEKPRLMASSHLGTDVPPAMISYYRAYDLFGDYDIEHLTLLSNGRKLTETELSRLYEEVFKRSKISFPGKQFCLPRSIVLSIWYLKTTAYDSKNQPYTSYRASQFRLLYSSFVQAKFSALSVGKLRISCTDESPGEVVDSLSEFFACSENSALLQDKFNEESLRKFYSKSIF